MITFVLKNNLIDLAWVVHGNKRSQCRTKLVLHALDDRVAEAVPAAVAVKSGLYRLPARIPDRVAILYVIVTTAGIERRISSRYATYLA